MPPQFFSLSLSLCSYRMPFQRLFPICFLNLRRCGIPRHSQQSVIILPLRFLQLQLSLGEQGTKVGIGLILLQQICVGTNGFIELGRREKRDRERERENKVSL